MAQKFNFSDVGVFRTQNFTNKGSSGKFRLVSSFNSLALSKVLRFQLFTNSVALLFAEITSLIVIVFKTD